MSVSGRLRYGLLDRVLERGWVGDRLLVARSPVAGRARSRRPRGGVEAQEQRLGELVERMRSGPLAESVGRANEQHYELPAEFFELFLGPRLKYSCALWTGESTDLAAAEEAMLELSCERAAIKDGM